MARRIPPDPRQEYPGLVEDIIIYGPHTMGVTDPDIELRVLVLIKDGSREPRMPSATWDISRR